MERAALLAALVLSGCGGSLGPDPRVDAAGAARGDAAKVDAGAGGPVDAQADAGPAAPGPNQVTCTCNDGTEVAVCASSTCAAAQLQSICGAECVGFGGLATASCVMRQPACAPTASSVAISCACGDGTTVGRCTTTECAGNAAMASACDQLCAAHAGSTGGSCQTDPTCFGPNLVECFCGGGTATPIDVCAGTDCSSGPAMDSVCKPVCAALGGLWGTGCFAASATCE
ncbi:MAG TPA: hypothetical protein VKZ18_16470 [Polyangia bacterium]|nr:hypothetical protein [Polyangia bacterium]